MGDDTVGNNGSTANDGLTGNNATDNGDKNNTNKDDSLLDDAGAGCERRRSGCGKRPE